MEKDMLAMFTVVAATCRGSVRLNRLKRTGRWLKQSGITLVLACAILLACLMPVRGAPQSSLPHLRKQGTATQLIVGGKPFLILAGELGNSSSSSLEYMRPVWPKLAAM